MRLRLCLGVQVSWSSLLGEQFFQALPVETHDHFAVHHDGRRDLAAIRSDQLKYSFLVCAHIALFERNASLREVGLRRIAGRSAGLREEENFLRLTHSILFPSLS